MKKFQINVPFFLKENWNGIMQKPNFQRPRWAKEPTTLHKPIILGSNPVSTYFFTQRFFLGMRKSI